MANFWLQLNKSASFTTTSAEFLELDKDNNQHLIGATYHKQFRVEGCKRVITNSINCWNLLHLSGSHAECKKPADREALLKNILATSTHSWEHINMLGEYDFSEKVDFQTFNLDKIFKDGAEI